MKMQGEHRAAEAAFGAHGRAATNLLSRHVLRQHDLLGHKLRGRDGEEYTFALFTAWR